MVMRFIFQLIRLPVIFGGVVFMTQKVKQGLSEKWVLSLPPVVYLVGLFLIPTLLMVFIAFREPVIMVALHHY